MKKIKSIGSSFAIAFSMYSKIPMPQAEWSEENRKYVICFFPLVGAVAGALCYAWYRLCGGINAGAFFYTAGMAAIPLFLTGGIHVDGFMDTMDALHSYRDREEKLRILKDSHIGAFAVICLLGYYLTYLGGISELKSDRAVLCFCLGFLLSRTLSGLSLVYFPAAKRKDFFMRSPPPPIKGVSAWSCFSCWLFVCWPCFLHPRWEERLPRLGIWRYSCGTGICHRRNSAVSPGIWQAVFCCAPNG